MPETHEGYLFIADITGYTHYLSVSELEHAQGTLTALLTLLVDNTRPPLIISRLAGDAVISYGLRESFYHGQTFLEKIEDTYVAFRKAIERLVRNNICRCNACANISSLDLKFFIHYGAFGIQRISDHDELVGNDVNLLHRLLKNRVTAATGMRAYALFTQAAIDHLGIIGLTGGMVPHSEAYEHLGEVQVWVEDMQPVWEQKRRAATVIFPAGEIWMRKQISLGMPIEQVWEYLTQPEFRTLLMGSDRVEIANRNGGRIGQGSIYQCYHGDKVLPMTILEWQPFQSMIVKELPPFTTAASWLSEYRLEPTEGGTQLTITSTKPAGSIRWRLFLRMMTPVFRRMDRQRTTAIKQHIEADYERRKGTAKSALVFTGEQIRASARAGLQSSAAGENAIQGAGQPGQSEP